MTKEKELYARFESIVKVLQSDLDNFTKNVMELKTLSDSLQEIEKDTLKELDTYLIMNNLETLIHLLDDDKETIEEVKMFGTNAVFEESELYDGLKDKIVNYRISVGEEKEALLTLINSRLNFINTIEEQILENINNLKTSGVSYLQ